MMTEEVPVVISAVGPSEQNKRSKEGRKERPPRACTARTSSRRYPLAPFIERTPKKEKDEQQQCSKTITELVAIPSPSQLPRWKLRAMWELASLLNFLHIFRPFLNISVEFSAEELETALITPNNTLGDIHIPLLRAIPPITRMALGSNTWVTVLCRKLKDWWHWVAEGEIPIVASHGAEIETYNNLDPATRVIILKALCDIRVEQEDIRSYIDGSIRHGVQLSAFRKERIGGDSHGISYWYEDDPIIGHRLYREIKKVEIKEGRKTRVRGNFPPVVSCQWETVATDFDEFHDVSEKLFSSRNRTETALGKRLKIDLLPEIEKIHKRKERALKKQHRQALLLDSFLVTDGLISGRSLRDRKPVTYTFDDFDRSINEAIKITKKSQSNPEPILKRESFPKPDVSANGKSNGPSHVHQPSPNDDDIVSAKSSDYEEIIEDHNTDNMLDRSDRKRQRPQRYSDKEYVEAISDHDAELDSDDDIVGEAVYDDEYLSTRKQRKVSSSSEGDEEYRWDEDNAAEEESFSLSDGEDEPPRKYKKLPSRRAAKLRSRDEMELGLRRSKRATRINYRQYEQSDSDMDSVKNPKSSSSEKQSDDSNNVEYIESQDSHDEEDEPEDEPENDSVAKDTESAKLETMEEAQVGSDTKSNNAIQQSEPVLERQFLDLNEMAPGVLFDDGPTSILKGDDTQNF